MDPLDLSRRSQERSTPPRLRRVFSPSSAEKVLRGEMCGEDAAPRFIAPQIRPSVPHSGLPHARAADACAACAQARPRKRSLGGRTERRGGGVGGGVPDLFSLCVQQWLETVTRTCGRVFPSFSICVFPTSLKGYNPDKGAGQKFTHSHTLRSLCFTYNMNFSKRNAIKYLYSQPENISQHTRWFI